MATVTINYINILDDGRYKFTLKTATGNEYNVILTAAQSVDIATVQSTINSMAQPLKYVGQTITVTYT